MLPVSRKCDYKVQTNQVLERRAHYTKATGHSKLFQEGNSDREHCFSHETRDFLKQPMYQQGFTLDSMKFDTWGHVYAFFYHAELDGMKYTSGC